MNILKLKNFSGNVLVVGDVMLDRYYKGSCSRISPEAPVPVVKVDDIENRAGGAANVAINIASLGAKCNLVGVVGKDEAAEKLENLIKSDNLECNFVKSDSLPTITKLRVLSRNQQLLRLDFEDKYENIPQGSILQEVRRIVKGVDVIICSDYGKGSLSSVSKIIKIAKEENVPCLIDPKGTDFIKYKGATLLTPNMSEFKAVAGEITSEEDLVDKAYSMITEYNLEALLITRSEDGMTLVTKNREVTNLPTHAREVFDVTGAGDTVIATLATCLASKMSLVNSCKIANVAAGIVVGKIGTSTVTIDELISNLSGKDNSIDSNIVNEEQLMSIVSRLKLQNKKIVMTNGCFDILHRGHVDYLQRAKALGDILIVAVNSDKSVKALKGESRPIVELENRMAVLSALESVDYVVAFDEDTPLNLISKVKPDILVKGGDYTVEQIAGHKEVLENNGSVIILPFIDGCSTTNIVNKISKRG